MKEPEKKVLLGMSGGVDSSVSARLLQEEGFEVAGVFIDFVGGGKSEKDFRSAEKIAQKLKIPINRIDARQIFKKEIIDKFVADYEKGLTPNPCVRCNPEMKFQILLEEADRKGINFVATGHYASIVKQEYQDARCKIQDTNKFQNPKELPITCYRLLVAKDKTKDQSYFLYRLNQEQLARIIFPLGNLLKSEVRKMADENGFGIKSEEESQDVCFISNNDFDRFIRERIKNNPGDIVDEQGQILGDHEGLHLYTIGQRKGINLGGDGPYYVIGKNMEKNELVVSNSEKCLGNHQGSFRIREANWILPDREFPLETLVRVRYHGKVEKAEVVPLGKGEFEVKTEISPRAVTPGQSAVFYTEEGEVSGGGIIV